MKNLLLVVSLVILLCFTISCKDKAAMAELEKFRAQAKVGEQNKELFRKFVEEWNKGNYEFIKDAIAPDYAYYSPSENPKSVSREEGIEMLRAFREALPDSILSSEELVAVGDIVISRNIV